MLDRLRRYLRWRAIKRLINVATEMIYSDQLDIDSLVSRMAVDKSQQNMVWVYMAIQFAAETKIEPNFNEYLRNRIIQDFDAEVDRLRIDAEAVLEMHKLMAESSLIKRQIDFDIARMADEFSYTGLVYRAEMNKRGPLSHTALAMFKEKSEKLAALESALEAENELHSGQ